MSKTLDKMIGVRVDDIMLLKIKIYMARRNFEWKRDRARAVRELVELGLKSLKK